MSKQDIGLWNADLFLCAIGFFMFGWILPEEWRSYVGIGVGLLLAITSVYCVLVCHGLVATLVYMALMTLGLLCASFGLYLYPEIGPELHDQVLKWLRDRFLSLGATNSQRYGEVGVFSFLGGIILLMWVAAIQKLRRQWAWLSPTDVRQSIVRGFCFCVGGALLLVFVFQWDENATFIVSTTPSSQSSNSGFLIMVGGTSCIVGGLCVIIGLLKKMTG